MSAVGQMLLFLAFGSVSFQIGAIQLRHGNDMLGLLDLAIWFGASAVAGYIANDLRNKR